MMTKQIPSKTPTARQVGSGGFQDIFQGTTAIYVIERNGSTDLFVGDYEIDALSETWQDQLRANRQRQKRQGDPVAKLPDGSLHDKVLIAFGPKVSPEQAIAALERAIESITNDGLLIGTDAAGSIAWEQTNGDVKV